MTDYYTDSALRDRLRDTLVGGGEPYGRQVGPDEADAVVSTAGELADAASRSNATVYVEDSAEIELTRSIDVAAGVTIASGRGREGSIGALLYTHEEGVGSAAENGIIRSRSPDVRVTGLRLRGPRPDASFTRWDYDETHAYGLRFYDDCEIDNCEIWGFPFGAMRFGGRSYTPEARVHHNALHSSYQIGMGYALDITNGFCHVHHNYMNDTRHSVNGYGFPSCGYRCEHNVFGPDTYSHAVDMHCLGENFPSGSRHLRDSRGVSDDSPWYFYRAGGRMEIRYNTFCYDQDSRDRDQEAIAIRGEPAEGVWIERNRFFHPEAPPHNSGNSSPGYAWRQVNVTTSSSTVPTDEDGWTENFHWEDNQFGPTEPYHTHVGAPVHLDDPYDGEPIRDEHRRQGYLAGIEAINGL